MPDASTPRVIYLTAGAAGMVCGSCLHDNTLARALLRQGVDLQLVPTYTPTQTDEENVSNRQIFFGGINVYLQQRWGRWGHFPRPIARLLDSPRLIRWATRRASAVDAKALGELTLSMLQGRQGRQRRSVEQLVDWLRIEGKPDLMVLSNLLIGGSLPAIREVLDMPVLVTLQGDDLFLDSLAPRYREEAVRQMRRLAKEVDGFLVHSQFYAEKMAELLAVPADRFNQVPLGIELPPGVCSSSDAQQSEATPQHARAANRLPLKLGYLARIAPEKGLHLLVDAFIELKRRSNLPAIQLHVAGYLGDDHQAYYAEQVKKLRQAECLEDYHFAGQIDRPAKWEFLSQLDLFSLPTTYQEPKGLSLFESLAAGVPVVQPNHGAFPELVHATGGGILVAPDSVSALADGLESLLCDPPRRAQLATAGRKVVHEQFSAEMMAKATWRVMQQFLR